MKKWDGATRGTFSNKTLAKAHRPATKHRGLILVPEACQGPTWKHSSAKWLLTYLILHISKRLPKTEVPKIESGGRGQELGTQMGGSQPAHPSQLQLNLKTGTDGMAGTARAEGRSPPHPSLSVLTKT